MSPPCQMDHNMASNRDDYNRSVAFLKGEIVRAQATLEVTPFQIYRCWLWLPICEGKAMYSCITLFNSFSIKHIQPQSTDGTSQLLSFLINYLSKTFGVSWEIFLLHPAFLMLLMLLLLARVQSCYREIVPSLGGFTWQKKTLASSPAQPPKNVFFLPTHD